MSRSHTAALLFGLACLLPLTLAVSGCSPIPEFGEATVENTYEIGVEAAQREDYLLAIEAFKRVTLDFPMDGRADDALLGLADAHRAIGDFASAEDEYRRILTDYPRSDLIPEATYKLGLSYYEQSLPAALDQSMTEQAIAQLRRFVAAHPESDLVGEAEAKVAVLRSRLAEKDYGAAVLYFSLNDPRAARIYLEAIVDNYTETEWAPKALLEEARSFLREGATAVALETYQRLIDLYPDTEEAALAAVEMAEPTTQ